MDNRPVRRPRAPRDPFFPLALFLFKLRSQVDPTLLPHYTLWTEVLCFPRNSYRHRRRISFADAAGAAVEVPEETSPMRPDLFFVAGEPSGDLQGAKLIEALLAARPSLKIGAVAGPRMRALPIQTFFPMENLLVMGFLDVIAALPKLARQFFAIRKKILALNPKAVVCVDYPGFDLPPRALA